MLDQESYIDVDARSEAEDILELDSSGTLEKKLKDAVEDAADPKGLDEDVKELSFDEKLDDDKVWLVSRPIPRNLQQSSQCLVGGNVF